MGTYHDYMRRRIEGLEPYGVPGWVGRKQNLPPFFNKIGVKTPKRFYEGNLSGLANAELPAEFVLKPEFGSTSHGVFIVLGQEEDGYVVAGHGEHRSIDFILDSLSDIERKYGISPGKGFFIAEELMRDRDGIGPAPDIRAFMFQGRVGFFSIESKNRDTGVLTTALFDEDFEPIPVNSGRFWPYEKSKLDNFVQRPAPTNALEIASVAKRVSVAVPTPFARVDLYNSHRGIMLGEVTLTPGSFYYGTRQVMSDQESERLGRLWEEAENRLLGSVPGGVR